MTDRLEALYSDLDIVQRMSVICGDISVASTVRDNLQREISFGERLIQGMIDQGGKSQADISHKAMGELMQIAETLGHIGIVGAAAYVGMTAGSDAIDRLREFIRSKMDALQRADQDLSRCCDTMDMEEMSDPQPIEGKGDVIYGLFGGSGGSNDAGTPFARHARCNTEDLEHMR